MWDEGFCIFLFRTKHHGVCRAVVTRGMGREGRADLALALTSLHHADTPGVDQRPLGRTPPKGGPLRLDEAGK